MGEANCDCGRQGRIDPVLKLWKYRELMLTENNVESGDANGSQIVVLQIVLHSNRSIRSVVVDGKRVPAALASKVKYVAVLDKQKQVTTMIEPKQFHFKAKFPPSVGSRKRETIQMKAMQIPFVVNNATTGFKLQGASVQNIVVTELSSGTKNWVYVLLLCVRTMNRLFLKEKIPSDLQQYQLHPRLTAMMSYFRSAFQPRAVSTVIPNRH